MKKVLLLTIAGLFVLAGNAMALGVSATSWDGIEKNLEHVFDRIAVDGDNNVNVYTDALNDAVDSYWMQTATGGSAVTMIIEIAGMAEGNTFGIYDASDPFKKVQIFAGSVDVVNNLPDKDYDSRTSFSIFGDGTVVIGGMTYEGLNFGSTFGFYLENAEGEIFYSDSSLNSDSSDHMMAYQGVGEDVVLNYLDYDVARTWTDKEYILAWEDRLAGETDWDFNDMVIMVESVEPVPEPGTVLLLGAGLLGVLGLGRKRMKK